MGDLVEHIGGLALAFTAAADKARGRSPSGRRTRDAARLPADWRTRIPGDLLAMAAAWRDPAAWTGMSKAGGVDHAGRGAGLVALDEIVIHGWDLAAAIGQRFDYEPDRSASCTASSSRSAPARRPAGGICSGRSCGAGEAPLLDRVWAWPAATRVGRPADSNSPSIRLLLTGSHPAERGSQPINLPPR